VPTSIVFHIIANNLN